MNALLFKELSDAHSCVQIQPGVPLYESFADLDDKVIIINGEHKTKDYIPQEGDVIVIRSIPRAPAVFYIVVLAIAAVGAIYVGYQSYQARKQIEKMKERMENMRDEVVNVPYLKGAKNTVATNKSQPYIIGTHLFTPYLLSKGYRKISGEGGIDQYYYVVLEGGFNQQVLRKIYCDDVVLKDFGMVETVPQEGIYTFDEDSPFYDADSLIEIAQDGNAFATSEFNVRVDIDEPGTELKKSDNAEYEDLIFTLPQYARSFNMVLLFNGLRAFDGDSGAKISRSVRVIPEYSLDSGTNWVPFTWSGMEDGYTITGNTNRQLRYNVTKSFTWAQVGSLTEPVLVRLRCTTPEYDGTAYDQCYVEYIQSAIYNPDKSVTAGDFVNESILDDPERALSTLIGLKIKATTSNADKLDRINVITSGVARTWDGTEWSATKVPTSNPAAWVLEILGSASHKPSQTPDADIDLDSFGAWYDSCVVNDLEVDMALIEGDTKENVINAIAQIGYAGVYDNIYGKKAVAVDEPKENAIAVLNPQNVLSFSCEKDMGRKVDGLKISFVNRDGGYVQDSYLVLRPGHTRTTDSVFRDVSVSGIVRYDQIVSYARRLMAVEELRPRSVAIKVGHEGIYFTPLSKVMVQHSALANGLGTGAEIKSVVDDGFSVIGVELYEPIEYDSTNPNGYGVVINCVSDTYSSTIARAYTAETNGKVYEIEFVSPIPLDDPAIPHAGDILAYGYLNDGEFDTVTQPMLITSIEPDTDGYALALVDYNEAIYEIGAYPTYTPNMTITAIPSAVPDTLPPATLDDVSDVIESIPAIVPGYRGRHYGIHPTVYLNGDWWLVYNDEGATGGDGIARGVYYVLDDVITLIDPSSTDVAYTKYRSTTLEDVLWASNNGYTLVGTVNDPYAVYGVSVMQYMAVNAAFVNYLGTNKIRLSSSGAMIGGNRYNDAGTVINAAGTGVYIAADGTVKFESQKGGLVIDSTTGTVTYTGVNVDLTDSALVSYEEGSATPMSFSHENLALVVRSYLGAELARLQYESNTGLWGGEKLGGLVDFVATWIKDATIGASSSLSALAVANVGMAMNRGTTALALANVSGITKSTDTMAGLYQRRTSAVYGSKLYIPINNQNLIEIYDLVTGDIATDTLSGTYYRYTSAIYGSKLFIPIYDQNLIEIYDLVTGDVATDTLSGSYSRATSAVYGSKLFIPINGANLIEIYDMATGDVTTDTLSGAYIRFTSAIYGAKLYIPIYDQNLIEIYDLATGDITTDTLSGTYSRYISAVYGSKLFIPIYDQNLIEIYDLVTGDVATDTLSGSYARLTLAVYGSKLYLPISAANLIEIYDLVTGNVTTDTLSGSYDRRTATVYGSRLFIPNWNMSDMDIVQLPYTIGLSYSSSAWGAAAEVAVYGMENLAIAKMADGRHMIAGEKNAGVWYCIRATDGSYGSCVELQADAHSPTLATLPDGTTICAYVHTATSYIGRKSWMGTAWGSNTSIALAATRPEFCVTEDYATLSYILTSTGKAFVLDCSDGTFPTATDTTVTAVRAQCQILPDLTYRLTYQLSTGYLYAAVGSSLTSWTATALETSGVTDFSVGILGTGETSILYAKSALLRRVDASACAGTNETKLMRAGMGFTEVGTDVDGDYYKLPNGGVLRPSVGVGPYEVTAGSENTLFAHDNEYGPYALPVRLNTVPEAELFSFSVPFSGSVRFSFDTKRSSGSVIYYYIFHNGVGIVSSGTSSTSYTTRSHDISGLVAGDRLSIRFIAQSNPVVGFCIKNIRMKIVENVPTLTLFVQSGFHTSIELV